MIVIVMLSPPVSRWMEDNKPSQVRGFDMSERHKV